MAPHTGNALQQHACRLDKHARRHAHADTYAHTQTYTHLYIHTRASSDTLLPLPPPPKKPQGNALHPYPSRLDKHARQARACASTDIRAFPDTHTHTHTHTERDQHTHPHARLHPHTRVHAHTHTHTHTCADTGTQTHTYTRVLAGTTDKRHRLCART